MTGLELGEALTKHSSELPQSAVRMLQAKTSNNCWLLLVDCEDLLLFFVICDSKWRVFGFRDWWLDQKKNLDYPWLFILLFCYSEFAQALPGQALGFIWILVGNLNVSSGWKPSEAREQAGLHSIHLLLISVISSWCVPLVWKCGGEKKKKRQTFVRWILVTSTNCGTVAKYCLQSFSDKLPMIIQWLIDW